MCHDHVQPAPPRMASDAPAEGVGERTLTGETVRGFPVAAYRWPVTDPNGTDYGHGYADHWSTPGERQQGVERLFSEATLLAALTQAAPEYDTSHLSRGEF